MYNINELTGHTFTPTFKNKNKYKWKDPSLISKLKFTKYRTGYFVNAEKLSYSYYTETLNIYHTLVPYAFT